MGWSASGKIEDKITDPEDLAFDPAYADLNEAEKRQADFLITAVNDGYDAAAIDGSYSLSFQGNANAVGGDDATHGEGDGRLHLYLNLVPVD